MKYVFAGAAAMAVLGLAACSPATETAQTHMKPDLVREVADARLAAVSIYADWCGSCKVLDPKVEAVIDRGGLETTSFIMLDITDKNEAAFFNAADTAGVGAPVRARYTDEIKTGELLLIDLDDQEIVGVVTKTMSEDEIKAAIEAAAAEA